MPDSQQQIATTLDDSGRVSFVDRTPGFEGQRRRYGFVVHACGTTHDLEDLTRWAGTLPTDAVVATTQKDWVKLRLPDLAGRPLRAVRIGLTFCTCEAEFAAVLEKVLSK